MWTHESSAHSCRGQFSTDTVKPVDGDMTSISMDMGRVGGGPGGKCFAFKTKCTFSMQTMRTLTWDAQWDGCDDVWTAPLWLTPARWHSPQGQSGEIDMMETCKNNHGRDGKGFWMKSSIMCSQHREHGQDCREPLYSSGSSSNGVKRFKAAIDRDGTWTMTMDGSLVSKYPHYLKTTFGANMQYHLVSDVWNGGNGDKGWHGCGQLSPHTKCNFKVTNIQLNGQPFPCHGLSNATIVV